MRKKTPFVILYFLVIVSIILLIGPHNSLNYTTHTNDTIQSKNTAYMDIYPEGLKISSFNATWGGPDIDKGRGIVMDNEENIYIVGDTFSYCEGGRI
jgi:hypothetical protein